MLGTPRQFMYCNYFSILQVLPVPKFHVSQIFLRFTGNVCSAALDNSCTAIIFQYYRYCLCRNFMYIKYFFDLQVLAGQCSCITKFSFIYRYCLCRNFMYLKYFFDLQVMCARLPSTIHVLQLFFNITGIACAEISCISYISSIYR